MSILFRDGMLVGEDMVSNQCCLFFCRLRGMAYGLRGILVISCSEHNDDLEVCCVSARKALYHSIHHGSPVVCSLCMVSWPWRDSP